MTNFYMNPHNISYRRPELGLPELRSHWLKGPVHLKFFVFMVTLPSLNMGTKAYFVILMLKVYLIILPVGF